MTLPAPVVFGGMAAVAAIVIWLVIADRRFRAARLAALRRDAVRRGWRFEQIDAPAEHLRIHRWEGAGLGGAWTAEAVERVRRRGRHPKVLRWWNAAADAPPPAGPLVVLLDIDGAALPELPAMPGRLAGLAQDVARSLFATAFERHFGSALAHKGRSLDRVDGAGEAAGLVVLSDHPAEAARRLTPAACDAIRQACEAPVWAAVGAKRPWVGLCGDRVVIAGAGHRMPDGAQIAAVVEAASGLVRARE